MYPNEVLNFCKEYFGKDALSVKEWEDFYNNLVAKHDTRFVDEISALHILMEMNRLGYAISIDSAMKLIDICEDELRDVIDSFLNSVIDSFLNSVINGPVRGNNKLTLLSDENQKLIGKGYVIYMDENTSKVIVEKIKGLKEKGY